MLSRLEILAPAKINLGLRVLRRRSDGYHDIETVFLGIGWADKLTIELERPSADPGVSMTCTDPGLPTDERNLCVRAVNGLMENLGVNDARVWLDLEKRVPYGAGLGGGSSDAAGALLGLSRLLGTRNAGAGPDLYKIAASIGSDVPFFLDPRPSLGAGRGELLEPISGYRFPFHLVIAVPQERISTAEAYAGVIPSPRHDGGLGDIVRSNDPQRWRAELVNDFETSIFGRHPGIAQLKQLFYDTGADYASMSGSGSAVFGAFRDLYTAQAAASEIERSWSGLECFKLVGVDNRERDYPAQSRQPRRPWQVTFMACNG